MIVNNCFVFSNTVVVAKISKIEAVLNAMTNGFPGVAGTLLSVV